MGRYIQRIGERAEKFRGPRSREGQGVRFEREGHVLLVERSGDGVVWRFGNFLAFRGVSAFGSGFGSGGFGQIIIRTILNKIKKKVPKTNGFRNFCVTSQHFRCQVILRKLIGKGVKI